MWIFHEFVKEHQVSEPLFWVKARVIWYGTEDTISFICGIISIFLHKSPFKYYYSSDGRVCGVSRHVGSTIWLRSICPFRLKRVIVRQFILWSNISTFRYKIHAYPSRIFLRHVLNGFRLLFNFWICLFITI